MSKFSLEECAMDTKLIHAGHKIDPTTHSMASPIFQTATFGFDTVEEMDEAWDKLGYLYTREGNPSVISLEEKLAVIAHLAVRAGTFGGDRLGVNGENT